MSHALRFARSFAMPTGDWRSGASERMGAAFFRWASAGLRQPDALAAFVMVLIAALLLIRMPDPVSGSDGGNWLALSGGLMGLHANAASTVYPPAFLVLLVLIRTALPPVEALRVVGALVALLPGIGAYLLLRSLGLRTLALAGLSFSFLGYSSEMIAWGGYPQLMGTGLAVIACATVVHGYKSEKSRYFAATGALAGLAVLTHQLAGLQAVLAVAAASAVLLLARPRFWRQRLQQWAVVVMVSAVFVLPGVPVYVDLVTRTGISAFNANAFSLSELVAFLTKDAPLVWGVIGLCGTLALLGRARAGAWEDVAALVGLGVASVGLTLLTLEVRALYLGLLLGFIATVLLFADLMRASGPRWRIALATTACALWATLLVAGAQRFDFTASYYTMLDPYLVDGLGWLGRHARSDDLAVSMRSRQKWPLGWWVQGLSNVPSYLDFDPRWLYFREEKRQAEIASSILANDDPQAAAIEAQRYGVTLLIFDARDTGQMDVWLHSGRVYGAIGLLYSNPSLTIFRVYRPVSQAARL